MFGFKTTDKSKSNGKSNSTASKQLENVKPKAHACCSNEVGDSHVDESESKIERQEPTSQKLVKAGGCCGGK